MFNTRVYLRLRKKKQVTYKLEHVNTLIIRTVQLKLYLPLSIYLTANLKNTFQTLFIYYLKFK